MRIGEEEGPEVGLSGEAERRIGFVVEGGAAEDFGEGECAWDQTERMERVDLGDLGVGARVLVGDLLLDFDSIDYATTHEIIN